MRPLRIAYVGDARGTCLHRANALRRLGHHLELFESETKLPKHPLSFKFHYETGGVFIGRQVGEAVWNAMGGRAFDVVWVDHGRFIDSTFVERCRGAGMKTVVVNIDDPFGRRDRFSWRLYRKTVSAWDLVVVFRTLNILENLSYGARNVLRVFMSADEVAHRPRELTPDQALKYSSDVLFVGTYMSGRGAFLKALTDQGVPVAIVGNRWEQCPEWSALKPHWRSPGVYTDEEYSAWIQSAKICLGLLSHGNRDLHTTRSSEIPAIGSLLCAERTPEHVRMYREGEEAVFWSDANECAKLCKELLADDSRREAIARAGHERVVVNKTMNEPVMASILDRLLAVTSEPSAARPSKG